MKPGKVFIFFLPLILFGCTTASMVNSDRAAAKMQIISAGYTGCKPKEHEIEIVELQSDASAWFATCKDKQYMCSVFGSSGGHSISCVPAVE